MMTSFSSWWKRKSRRTSCLTTLFITTAVCMFVAKLQTSSMRSETMTVNIEPKTVWRRRPIILTQDKLQSKSLARSVNDSIQFRLHLVQEKCEAGWQPRNKNIFARDNHFYYDFQRKLGYCHAAKAGCTFWLRIFSYLTRRKELKELGFKSPFSIPRILLHTGHLSPYTANTWQAIKENNILYDMSFRFLFARNPYSRVFSVYLDKYYLLGYIQTVADSKTVCSKPSGMSFDEFLELAFNTFDHHLIPISELCNPCEFKPHAIGKMENFKSDAQFILDKADYGSLLRHYNHSLHIEVELESIIKENFAFLANIQNRFGLDCISSQSLFRRLWNVFQFNGYIPSSMAFHENDFPPTKEGLFIYFRDLVRNHSVNIDESKLQRDRYQSKFYATLSSSRISQIQKRYKGDFELFGYSKYPPKYPIE